MTTYEFFKGLTLRTLTIINIALAMDAAYLSFLGLANQDEAEAIDYALVCISDILQERAVKK